MNPWLFALAFWTIQLVIVYFALPFVLRVLTIYYEKRLEILIRHNQILRIANDVLQRMHEAAHDNTEKST